MLRQMALAVCLGLFLAGPSVWAGDSDPGPVPVIPLSREEINQGWISLFDGRTLYGWEPNSDMNWSVRGGVIAADRGKSGLLLSSFELADYEFRCDYRLEKGGNSGIFLRTPFSPKNPAKDCYELNLCDSHPTFPTGSIVGRKKAQGTFEGEGAWMRMAVRVEGNRITARLNDQPVIDFTDDSADRLRAGRIGLQMNGGVIEFRNIGLRPLLTTELFNGRDLAGWHVVPGSLADLQVVNGDIRVSGGPGFLESDSVWDNFCLQFQARTGHATNSGVFFRAMKGTAKEPSNGYELQIQNDMWGRSAPFDAGTGAIYRRTKARWVVSDDLRWFTATLIANKAHFAVWVDGIQVTDWTDPRTPNQNPRRGLRLNAGHLSLQGHDRNTDVKFRRLEIARIPGV